MSSNVDTGNSRLAGLLSELREARVELWVEEGRLRYRAPDGVMTPELRARIAEQKAEITTLLAAAAPGPADSAPALVAGEPEARPPLSFSQQRLWFLHELEPESAAYNMFHPYRLRGELDEAALIRALEEVVRRT